MRGGGEGMKHCWLYPDNWEQLAWECKEPACWRCEFCGVPHGVRVVNEETGVVSTVCLAALCRSCHASYDWSWQERQCWLELEQLCH